MGGAAPCKLGILRKAQCGRVLKIELLDRDSDEILDAQEPTISVTSLRSHIVPRTHSSYPEAMLRAFHRATHIATQARSGMRSAEHTSELQSIMRISYAVFCLQ